MDTSDPLLSSIYLKDRKNKNNSILNKVISLLQIPVAEIPSSFTNKDNDGDGDDDSDDNLNDEEMFKNEELNVISSEDEQ